MVGIALVDACGSAQWSTESCFVAVSDLSFWILYPYFSFRTKICSFSFYSSSSHFQYQAIHFSFCDIFTPVEATSRPPLHIQTRILAYSLTKGIEDANEFRRLRREHKARVSALVQQNSNFYRRQRMCECVTMMTVLVSFTAFR